MGFGFDTGDPNADLWSAAGSTTKMGTDNRYTLGGRAPSDTWDEGTQSFTHDAGSAPEVWGRQQALGAIWAGQQAPQADYGQANSYLNGGNQMRGSQLGALALEQQAAEGKVPSVAQLQMQQGTNDAVRAGLAMQASARGAGAMGLGQYAGAQQAGQLQAQNIAATGQLRAQEMAAARAAYMQGATGIRGQDYGAAQMTGGWAQNQAELAMKNRQLALQGQLGFEGLAQNSQLAQLQAQQAQQAMEEGHWATQSGLDQASTALVNRNIGAGIGAVGALAGGI